MLGGQPLNLKVDVEEQEAEEQKVEGSETSAEITQPAKTVVQKPGYKPGRVNGRNSDYVSGSHFVPKKLYHEIEVLLSANRDKGAKSDKTVSAETQTKRRTNMRNFFSDLYFLGFKIQSVYNLRPKHLLAVFLFLEEAKQSPSTIQNKISSMRLFCSWIGKGDMMKESSFYVKNPASASRTTVVKEDKSWKGKGIDVMAKLSEISAGNLIVGIWLELCWTFGMRIKEAVMFRPFVAINDWGIWLVEGTKGTRGRFVPIETELQIYALERALSITDGKTGFTGKRGMSAHQKLTHFKHELQKYGVTLADIGVTAHGLRHQFMHEWYKKFTGIEPPIRGGDPSKLDKQQLHLAKQKLMEMAGHTRTGIGGAYYGSDQHPVKTVEDAEVVPPTATDKQDDE